MPRPPIKGAHGKKKASAQDDDEYFSVRLEQIQLEQVRPLLLFFLLVCSLF